MLTLRGWTVALSMSLLSAAARLYLETLQKAPAHTPLHAGLIGFVGMFATFYCILLVAAPEEKRALYLRR